MLGRVTTSMRVAQVEAGLQLSSAKLAQLTSEQSSGSTVTMVSDDPTAAAKAIAVQQQQARNTQYQSNASDASAWLAAGDTALSSAATTLTSVRNLVVEANNGSLNSTALSSISTQLQTLKSQLLSTANTQYLGRNVFAGTSDSATAFDSSSYGYNGSSSGTVMRRVGDDQSVRVDQNGASVFGTGSNSVFALIDTISSGLTSSGTVSSTALSSLDSYLSNIQTAEATTGAAENAVTNAQSTLTSQATTLTSQLSNLTSVDTAEMAVDVTAQQTNYQAALLATSKLLQYSLMNYLS